MKETAVRKGFTLVELLIVIVVIGILSAMMMLSSTEAVSSAKAAKIISDMRNLKTAALAYYADNLDYVEKQGDAFRLQNESADVLKYLGTNTVTGNYLFYSYVKEENNSNTDGVWYVLCKVDDTSVRKKLTSRAGTVKLLRSDDGKMINKEEAYSNHAYVGMRIR